VRACRDEVAARLAPTLEEEQAPPATGEFRQVSIRNVRWENVKEEDPTGGTLTIDADRVIWTWKATQVYAFAEPGLGARLRAGDEDITVPLRWVSIEKESVKYDPDRHEPRLVLRSLREGGGVGLRAGDGNTTIIARFVPSR